MAYVWRIFPLFFVIALAVGRINAAALQTSETIDLDGTTSKEFDSATYRPNEPGYVTVNESKLIIDLYTPQQTHESTPSEALRDEFDKSVTPFVQVVINQPNASGSSAIKDDEIASTEVPQTSVNPLQLIPPASVNATIKQLEKESRQKQGQIIIRYAFSSNLNFTFFFSVT